jgi:hypothetical protein
MQARSLLSASAASLWIALTASPVLADFPSLGSRLLHKDGLELRFVKLVNEPLAGMNPLFQIRVICDRAFNLTGLYVTGRDTTAMAPVTIEYNDAVALNNIFGPGFGPPTSWEIAHTDTTAIASATSEGLELLSNMSIQPIGIANGGSFDILGTRAPNTRQTLLSIGAVVETDRDPDNVCRIVLVDF